MISGGIVLLLMPELSLGASCSITALWSQLPTSKLYTPDIAGARFAAMDIQSMRLCSLVNHLLSGTSSSASCFIGQASKICKSAYAACSHSLDFALWDGSTIAEGC